MKNWLLLFGSLVLTLSSFAQANYGSLKGEVKEYDSWENVPFANVSLYQEGEMILGANTDFDGEYQINEIPPGEYDLQISYVGFRTETIKGVKIKANELKELNVELKGGFHFGCGSTIVGLEKPLFEIDNTTIEYTFSRSDIQNSPLRW